MIKPHPPRPDQPTSTLLPSLPSLLPSSRLAPHHLSRDTSTPFLPSLPPPLSPHPFQLLSLTITAPQMLPGSPSHVPSSLLLFHFPPLICPSSPPFTSFPVLLPRPSPSVLLHTTLMQGNNQVGKTYIFVYHCPGMEWRMGKWR